MLPAHVETSGCLKPRRHHHLIRAGVATICSGRLDASLSTRQGQRRCMILKRPHPVARHAWSAATLRRAVKVRVHDSLPNLDEGQARRPGQQPDVNRPPAPPPSRLGTPGSRLMGQPAARIAPVDLRPTEGDARCPRELPATQPPPGRRCCAPRSTSCRHHQGDRVGYAGDATPIPPGQAAPRHRPGHLPPATEPGYFTLMPMSGRQGNRVHHPVSG